MDVAGRKIVAPALGKGPSGKAAGLPPQPAAPPEIESSRPPRRAVFYAPADQ
jgi:hypothetical protein